MDHTRVYVSWVKQTHQLMEFLKKTRLALLLCVDFALMCLDLASESGVLLRSGTAGVQR